MKRMFIIIGIILLVLILMGISSLYFWMESSVKENIEIAKQHYTGTAEGALIAFLLDEKAESNEKTHIAIWTLGQIKSEKALPVLKALYKDDPEGETCFGKHDSVICQYEIYKAIEVIEGKMLFSHAHLNR